MIVRPKTRPLTIKDFTFWKSGFHFNSLNSYTSFCLHFGFEQIQKTVFDFIESNFRLESLCFAIEPRANQLELELQNEIV
jgi:hypothetical protein